MSHQFVPLAERMRPRNLSDFIGQSHLIGPGKPLSQLIKQKKLHAMIFWGPPGVGKTTLARLLAEASDAAFDTLSAVLAGVKDIRQVVEVAKTRLQHKQRTILFVDEVHRFNKAQQDAFLPHVESGLITLIGATTENPSFELNNALLSRVRVYVLKQLTHDDLNLLIDRVLSDREKGLCDKALTISEALRIKLIFAANGDARQLLNLLEILGDFAVKGQAVDESLLDEVLQHSVRRFDKQGEHFYDQISALHKAVRGTDPDAALYWLARMMDGGCDPAYLARRIVRMASEDIGNADPRGLTLALNAWEAYERLGSPEGELALAQAVAYLACAPKSNAVYTAFNEAWRDAKQYGNLEVPMHIRNAPTKLMKELGYHKGYRYAHDEANAYVEGEVYLPEALQGKRYYHPVSRGLELKIKEKLALLRKEKF